MASQKEEKLGTMQEVYARGFQSATISKSGDYIAMSLPFGTNVEILARDGFVIATTQDHPKTTSFSLVAKVEFSGDDSEIYTMYENGLVYVSDPMTGELLRQIKDRDAASLSFKLSADDSLIAIRYADGTSSVLNSQTGELLSQVNGDIYFLEGTREKVKRILGQEGDQLFEEDQDGKNYYASNEERLSKQDRNYAVTEFTSQDGKYLLTTITGNKTIISDLETGNRLRTLPMASDTWAATALMTADNKYIAYEYDSNTTIITSLYTKDQLLQMSKEILEGRNLNQRELLEEGFLERTQDEK